MPKFIVELQSKILGRSRASGPAQWICYLAFVAICRWHHTHPLLWSPSVLWNTKFLNLLANSIKDKNLSKTIHWLKIAIVSIQNVSLIEKTFSEQCHCISCHIVIWVGTTYIHPMFAGGLALEFLVLSLILSDLPTLYKD